MEQTGIGIPGSEEKEMEQFRIKPVSSVEKVLPTREPSGAGMTGYMTALQDETVSFQIAYYWNGPWKSTGQIRVNAPEDLNVKVRIVNLVPCAYPCHTLRDENYLATEPGMYPDLLSDPGNSRKAAENHDSDKPKTKQPGTEVFGNQAEYEFPLIGGQWRSLWIDIETTKETAAGEHKTAFELSCEEGVFKTEMTVDVIHALLPKNPILHTEWFHNDGLAHYYGVEVFSEEHWRIVENFICTAVKRGCNMILTPIFTPPLDTAIGGERLTAQLVDVYESDGTYTFGYEKFERWVAMCERCGVQYFEMSHLFSQWGAKYAPKIMGVTGNIKTEQTVCENRKTGDNGERSDRNAVQEEPKRLFGWETDAAGPEYTAFLHAFLDSFLPELEKLGIEKRCYFHISDEPNAEQMESYRAARAIVEEQLRDYPIIDALSDYAFYKEGLVKEPICATNHIEPFLADRPKKLWAYYCTGQYQDVSNRFIVMQGSRTRVIGLQLYKYAIDGFLQWGYNFYNSQYSLFPINPYACTDADGAFPSGDSFLVYPGEGGVPEESLRLMLMSEAMNDLAAMKLLEELAGRDRVIECLDERNEGEITFAKYPSDVDYVLKVRERVNAAIRDCMDKRES